MALKYYSNTLKIIIISSLRKVLILTSMGIKEWLLSIGLQEMATMKLLTTWSKKEPISNCKVRRRVRENLLALSFAISRAFICSNLPPLFSFIFRIHSSGFRYCICSIQCCQKAIYNWLQAQTSWSILQILGRDVCTLFWVWQDAGSHWKRSAIWRMPLILRRKAS